MRYGETHEVQKNGSIIYYRGASVSENSELSRTWYNKYVKGYGTLVQKKMDTKIKTVCSRSRMTLEISCFEYIFIPSI